MKILNQKETGYNCGGKANNLFIIKEMGINVPLFVVIPAEVCNEIVKDTAKAQEQIQAFEFTVSTIEQITSQLQPSIYFSVRSSATDEDGAQHSFAGQFESYLFVSKLQLAEKIKQVWLSAYSQRVTDYRKNNYLQNNQGMAVIIQQMIDAEVSGVAFGANPISGNRKEKIISSVYGLGEGLVSGELNADTFILKSTGEIETNIALKTNKIAFDKTLGNGTILLPIDSSLQTLSSLNEEQIHKIGTTLHQLLKHYKTYQDIEFAFQDKQFYLLQTRPVTSIHKLPDSSGEFIIWDNSNIIESYPGVTTPLTFSFILPVYEAVYRQFAMMMGVSQKEVNENKETFANMLGLINGRVYYNLLSWYKALALLPGYSLNAEFMEKMMGVKERFELTKIKERSKLYERLRVINMVIILLKNLRVLPKLRIKFVEEFEQKLNESKAIDYSEKSADELMYLYLDFEQTLLKKWKAPLVNDFFAMIYFGVLQKLVVKYNIDSQGTVQNDLMCGAKDIISTEPIRLCLELATLIQSETTTKNIFLSNNPDEIYKLHLEQKLPIKVSEKITYYILRFGNRCVGELKLETITYSQNPAAFIKIIKSYVEQGVTETSSGKDKDTELRHNAEEKVKMALKRKPLKKFVFNYFLKRARVLVSSRENLRYERTRAFGVVRELFCTLGDKFYAEGLIESPRDIFYLTKTEAFDYIKGTSVNYQLKELITLRKKQFSTYQSETPGERIDTKGIVYAGNNFFTKQKNTALDGELEGIGCCPGRIKARVQVVRDPNEVTNLNGDILVTSSTDPGWVTLFPTASGILVERGSLLSHSAIVSREMGKPCIVGISGLLEKLKTGDVVEMDGSTGEIKIISNIN